MLLNQWVYGFKALLIVACGTRHQDIHHLKTTNTMKEMGIRKKKKKTGAQRINLAMPITCRTWACQYLYAIGNVGSSTCGIPMN
jgi:hypothetical protein